MIFNGFLLEFTTLPIAKSCLMCDSLCFQQPVAGARPAETDEQLPQRSQPVLPPSISVPELVGRWAHRRWPYSLEGGA